ncbi:MAG: hypothetical protein R3C18_21060 [Planctomycetaceae bacterium]
MNTLHELRDAFVSNCKGEIVSPPEFLLQLTGRLRLERCDEPSVNLIGVRVSSSGRRLYVPEEQLSRWRQSRAVGVLN